MMKTFSLHSQPLPTWAGLDAAAHVHHPTLTHSNHSSCALRATEAAAGSDWPGLSSHSCAAGPPAAWKPSHGHSSKAYAHRDGEGRPTGRLPALQRAFRPTRAAGAAQKLEKRSCSSRRQQLRAIRPMRLASHLPRHEAWQAR